MMRSPLGCLVLVAIALNACTDSQRITSPADDLAVSYAKAPPGGTSAYTPADLGVLPGDQESYAWSANDAGYVVVQSNQYPSTGLAVGHWYVKSGSTITRFTPNSTLSGISNGTTPFILSGRTRWTFNPSSGFTNPLTLDSLYGSQAGARAVNELGMSTGTVSYVVDGVSRSDAVIWNADGTGMAIPNPKPDSIRMGGGRDINNSGDVVISYNGALNPGVGMARPDRGYIRVADGAMIELLPMPGQRSTYAYGVSERVGGIIYVAGTSDDDNGSYNAVRWTIDVATHAVVAATVVPGLSYSEAIADNGALVGVLAGSSQSGFVWPVGGSVQALKTPKSGTAGRVWGISGNGRYIAGDAKFGSYRHAVLWTAP